MIAYHLSVDFNRSLLILSLSAQMASWRAVREEKLPKLFLVKRPPGLHLSLRSFQPSIAHYQLEEFLLLFLMKITWICLYFDHTVA